MHSSKEGFFRDPDIDAWVDLLTNFASLPNVRPEHVRAFEQGQVPLDIVNTVMHEMMHHWCFFSPVGEVLALLQYRVRHALLGSLEGRQIDGLDVANDLVRYEIAEKVLGPIIEGLALFTEHDVVAGGTDESYCRPFAQLGQFILHGLAETGGHRLIHVAEVDEWLQRNRTRPEGVKRKADLLAEPLNLGKSIYLAGYLTLKAFIIIRNPVFGGSYDKMLGYLRSYFFHDYGLVDALFGPRPHDDDPVIIARRVSNYLLRRIKYLFQRDLTSDVKEWDTSQEADADRAHEDIELNGGTTYRLFHPMCGLDVSAQAAANGYSWHRRLLKVFDTSNESPLLEGHKLRGLQEFANRRLMPICSEPVEAVNVDGTVEVRSFQGDTLARMQKIASFDGKQRGLISFFFVPSTSAMLGAVFVNGIAIAASLRPEGDLHSMLRLLEPTPMQLEALERSKKLDRELIENQLGTYGGLIHHVQQQYADIQGSIYLPAVSTLICASNVEWHEALHRLDEFGILSVLDTKSELLDIARLSLIASRPHTPADLRAQFATAGRDFDATLALIGRIRDSYGLDLIDSTTDDQIVSIV